MELNEIPIRSHIPQPSGKFNAVNVPTLDEDVRLELAKYGQAVELPSEDNSSRRDRLIRVLEDDNLDIEMLDDGSDQSLDDEDFYTPGTQELYDSRMQMLKNSLSKASERINRQRQLSKKQDLIKILKHRRSLNKTISDVTLQGSQLITGNTRTLSVVRFSQDSSLIACGSWDGSVYFLKSDDLSTKYATLPGYHTEKTSAIDWSPSDHRLLISGGNEGNINFWQVDGTEKELKPHTSINRAHKQRITKTLFHPSGRHIISTSFDQTWKLWDIETQAELVQQEGHSKEVFCGSFHQDGGLFASGGLDGIVRIWDLRSGRSICQLDKHIQGVYSMDWSPNGYHLATASGDCSVKIWDIRRAKSTSDELFSIPAHTKLVSDVKFFNRRSQESLSLPCSDESGANEETLDSTGTFLITSSYDGLVNMWSADNWIRINTLKGHTDKVTSCDVSGDGRTMVSCGWDRSVKIWGI